MLVPLDRRARSDFGGPGAQAADLAATQVNAAAEPIGLNLTLFQEDTKSDPQAAAEAATKLVESDGVTAIAGPWGTDEVTTVAENVTIPGGHPDRQPVGDPAGDHRPRRRRARVPHTALGRHPGPGAGPARRPGDRRRRDPQHRRPQRLVRHRARRGVHQGLGGGRRHGRQERPLQPAGREPQLRGPAARLRQPGRVDDHRLRGRRGRRWAPPSCARATGTRPRPSRGTA